jgi:hypothetical protein
LPRHARVVVVLAAIVAALAVTPAGARAGAIVGTLWMPGRAVKKDAKTLPDAKRQQGAADAVIYVERVPDVVERDLTTVKRLFFFRRPLPARVTTVVQRQRFEPRVAAVVEGARVAFVNLDRVYHNVFSVSPARRFDAGKNPPGSRDTLAFEKPGLVNLHCDIHPDEQGYVVVVPNHAFARPDSLGRYRLPKLPAGDYTVRVFHPRLGEFTRPVTVPKKGDVTLELSR